MPDRFIDTNIILYLLEESPKGHIAEHVLQQGGAISVQVLNECLSNLRRKSRLEFSECTHFLHLVRQLVTVSPVTIETHDVGRALAEKYQLSIYDSLIAASALIGGCEILYSEDMQDGLLIENSLTIRNPFKPDYLNTGGFAN